jgi:hypothetical protein
MKTRGGSTRKSSAGKEESPSPLSCSSGSEDGSVATKNIHLRDTARLRSEWNCLASASRGAL